MTRRDFLATTLLGAGALAVRNAMGLDIMDEQSSGGNTVRRTLAGIRNQWTISHTLLKEKLRFFVLSDAHLTLDDARGEPFRAYSERMSTPYRTMRHWRTGEELVSPAGFEKALACAVEAKADFLAITGDLVSFPSEAGVEYALGKLNACGIPWMYIAGNHDWHYEGWPGTLREQRDEWAAKRLRPLYQGANPLFAMRKVKGVRMVFLDDSDWEVLPEQSAFFQEQAASGDPIALFLHIPLYIPGYPLRNAPVAHPEWKGENDWIWEIEKRPRWPKEGASPSTLAFREAVFSAPNVVGVFAGHIHEPMAATANGIPQLVAETASAGAFLDVQFRPLP